MWPDEDTDNLTAAMILATLGTMEFNEGLQELTEEIEGEEDE